MAALGLFSTYYFHNFTIFKLNFTHYESNWYVINIVLKSTIVNDFTFRSIRNHMRAGLSIKSWRRHRVMKTSPLFFLSISVSFSFQMMLYNIHMTSSEKKNETEKERKIKRGCLHYVTPSWFFWETRPMLSSNLMGHIILSWEKYDADFIRVV